MRTNKISVLVVDDSPSARELLTYIINRSPLLEVIGCVEDGEKALQFLKFRRPDVITMDVVMPRMDGFETTRRIMEKTPIPIVVITSSFNPDDVNKSFKAIDAGSVAILEKPRGPQDPQFPLMAKSIVETIANMADIKLVTRRHHPSLPTSRLPLPEQRKISVDAIAIGASLGGPQALQTILSELPASFPVPIFIVQHISQGFIRGFADWLAGATKLRIRVADHGYQAEAGDVIIAPDRFHLGVDSSNCVILTKARSMEELCPSVSHLFASMAETHGPRSIGLILTGMGRDGVSELLQMKQRGAVTIAQGEEGCIMFGMPKEAIALNAAEHVIPLHAIARTIQHLAVQKCVH